MNPQSIHSILANQHLDTDRGTWERRLSEVTSRDVEAALAWRPGSYSQAKLLALVSPAAEEYLERMAVLAQQLTIQRFGRAMRLYAPVYLSSYCVNRCRYCGFNWDNTFTRARLTVDEAVAQAQVLASEGYRDILLVSSEDKAFIDVPYLAELAKRLKAGRRFEVGDAGPAARGPMPDAFSFIGIEIYQMSAAEYEQLFAAGIDGVTLYQETYDREVYARYHPGGPKADYDTRLCAPDDMGQANMREIGLGVLLGLADWRIETLALAEHAWHLMRRHWQSRVSFSFPRLRSACGVSSSEFPHLLADKNLVQMMLALRLCFSDSGIVLSTREPAYLRDRLMGLVVTRISAGSRTSPGGYTDPDTNTGQFDVVDSRSPGEVVAVIRDKGFDPVWKDWDRSF
ncbi:MAG TPA: radical SAM protein [Sedimentisphaerales bacterium]|nr:radical SAM protein [Sedimentisphaerales bacterium]